MSVDASVGAAAENETTLPEELFCIKVTNLNPEVDEGTLRELFENIGEVLDTMVAEGPPMMPTMMVMKAGFCKFATASDRDTAVYLNQIILLDRPIFVQKIEEYPKDLMEAVRLLLPTPPAPPKPVAVPMGANGRPLLVCPTSIPQTVAVPPYPELAPNLDDDKIDEIRRTIYCGNLASYATAEDLKKFFKAAGEVLFCRMAGDESQPTRFAFVEFKTRQAEQSAVRLSGANFYGRPVKVNHSKNSVSKPAELRSGMRGKEATEAMRKVNSVALRVARKKERIQLRKMEDMKREAQEREMDRVREERRKRREAEHAAADKRAHEARERREKMRERVTEERESRGRERKERGNEDGAARSRSRSRSVSPGRKGYRRGRSRSPTRARRRSRSRSPGRRRRGSRSPEPRRRGSRSPEPRRRGSRSPEPRRRGSRSPEPRRRGSRSPEPRRRGSRSPEPRRRRSSRSPGRGGDKKRRKDSDRGGDKDDTDWAGRKKRTAKEISGDEDESKTKKRGPIKVGGMRGFDD